MRVTFKRVNLKGWNPRVVWYWADKDGGPVLTDHAVWWKHIHGFVLFSKYEVIFRHHAPEWDWYEQRYK